MRRAYWRKVDIDGKELGTQWLSLKTPERNPMVCQFIESEKLVLQWHKHDNIYSIKPLCQLWYNISQYWVFTFTSLRSSFIYVFTF